MRIKGMLTALPVTSQYRTVEGWTPSQVPAAEGSLPCLKWRNQHFRLVRSRLTQQFLEHLRIRYGE